MADSPVDRLEPAFNDVDSVRRSCETFRQLHGALREQVARAIVGQDEVVEQTLIALFSDGHVLLEGVP